MNEFNKIKPKEQNIKRVSICLETYFTKLFKKFKLT